MEVNNIAQNKEKIKSVVFKGILKLILVIFVSHKNLQLVQ
jgi:hypothetical protein